MGCGKSSVGKRLSELLCCRFADLDAVIEEKAGCSVAEIFERFGEAEFRRMEQETLSKFLETHCRVLGIPMAPASASLQHPLAGGGMPSPSSSTTAGSSHSVHASPILSHITPETEQTGYQIENTDLLTDNSENISGQSDCHGKDSVCHPEQSEGSVNTVLALGGGAVMTSGSDRIVHEGSLCIYLRTSVDELVARLSSETSGRPLLKSNTIMSSEAETSALRMRILELMSRRASTYERVAHLIIDTDGKTIDQVAREILERQ